MYGKIFSQIFDGTLATKGPWQALVTFEQLIVLANKHGEVDMTAEAISRRTTIPIDYIRIGLEALVLPDPDSRSPDEEGRRIVLIDPTRTWGWRIVNHEHYRKIRSEEERREYHKQYMRKRRAVNLTVNLSTTGDACQPISVSSKQDANTKESAPNGAEVETKVSTLDCPTKEIVNLYHEILPMLPRVEKLTKTRIGYIKARWREDLKSLDQWQNFFDFVSRSAFLTGRTEGYGDRPPFRADIEWLCRPSNFAKIAEDKYHRG